VSEGPFFPPPAPRGAYREPSERKLTEATGGPKRIVVTRREDLSTSTSSIDTPELGGLASAFRVERGDGVRHNFATRHPRIAGVVVTLLSGHLTASAIGVLLHGGLYTTRTAVGGPLGLALGLYLLAFGIPRDPSYRATTGWKTGLVVVSVVGLVAGVFLLYLLDASP
jgi:hypothetical protein